jgi:Spy/CpxP family protein refolding chaperone
MNSMRISFLLCAVIALGSLASAQGQGRGQGPRPKPELTAWWDQPVVRDLGLSDEQDKQIRATVSASRDHLIQLRGAVDSAEGALRDLMDADRVDTKRAEAAIEQVVQTHADMMRAVSLMSLKLRAILTSTQWQELQKRQSQPPPPFPGQPQKKKEPGTDPDEPPRGHVGDRMGVVALLFPVPGR